MTFEECCLKCFDNKELVAEFNRLKGHKLGVKRTPFQKMFDDSCNYKPDEEAFPDFCNFVYDFIWTPLLMQDKEAN